MYRRQLVNDLTNDISHLHETTNCFGIPRCKTLPCLKAMCSILWHLFKLNISSKVVVYKSLWYTHYFYCLKLTWC